MVLIGKGSYIAWTISLCQSGRRKRGLPCPQLSTLSTTKSKVHEASQFMFKGSGLSFQDVVKELEMQPSPSPMPPPHHAGKQSKKGKEVTGESKHSQKGKSKWQDKHK